MHKLIRLNSLLLSLITSSAFAATTVAIPAPASHSGVTLSYVAIGKDPEHTQAYRAALWYQPKSTDWNEISLYFAGSAGHWAAQRSPQHHSLNIYAIAPVLHFTLTRKYPNFTPYFEISVGASYLTKTRIDDHNLGMHFAFQDEIGMGAILGKDQRLTAGISVVHYSNGSLCSMNAGITAPLVVSLGYRFS